MVRRMTPAQARAAMQRAARDAQRAAERQRQAHNEAVRKAQQAAKKQQEGLKRSVEQQNRSIREYNRGVRQYNAKARSHNQKVENQRRRLIQELKRLQSRPVTVRVTYRSSVQHLATAYETLEHRFQTRELSTFEQEFLDRASEEAANSAYLANALDGDVHDDEAESADDLSIPSVIADLGRFSQDLVSRWTGALFALNPANPDAARHFCTSAREVLTSILDIAAPDSVVIRAHAECDVTDQGNPTRRAKIRYLLSRKGITDVSADQFVEADIDNAVSLFTMFNKGTHGVAECFSIPQLSALRTRVEASIGFLNSII
jgi:Predicted pPIWI-associating nuclease